MLARLRPRMTYANVVATLALFVAVGGGTAFAVVAANQVNSASIIDHQVKNRDLAANSVGTFKVIDGSLRAGDFAPGQLPKGERGPKGETGPKGDAGPPGANGATNVEVRRSGITPVSPTDTAFEYASCLPGETLTGGGAFQTTSSGGAPSATAQKDFVISQSYPSGNRWVIVGLNRDANNNNAGYAYFRVSALCAKP